MVYDGLNTTNLSKEIDFIPSKGLIIYEPIVGTINEVRYSKAGYHAQLEKVLEPTNPDHQVEFLKKIGFIITSNS